MADRDESELELKIRSGDYFVGLATLLDAISLELSDSNQIQSLILQKLIDELLYLQKNYYIVKNHNS